MDSITMANIDTMTADEDNLIWDKEFPLQFDETDDQLLYDESLGFEDVQNFKKPMLGFSDATQSVFFPKIDEQSGILFEIVQDLESAYLKSSQKVLKEFTKTSPVAIPCSRLSVSDGGPEIKLRIVDKTVPDSLMCYDERLTKEGLPPPISDAAAEKYFDSFIKESFSEDMTKILMAPLLKGWKREIVIRSQGGATSKKLGDIYYFSPEGMKFRSSKQVALHLQTHPDIGLTVENFTFSKARVSYDPTMETIRYANGARHVYLKPTTSAPVPKKSTIAFSNAEVTAEPEEVKSRAGRRSIQPPKRYANDNVVVTEQVKRGRPPAEPKIDHNEEMQMGMLPPKYPMMNESEHHPQPPRNRRGRPPNPNKVAGNGIPHNNKTYVGKQTDEGPLFGISALTQSPHFGQQLEQGMMYEFGGEDEDDGLVLEEETSDGRQPCSIRCAGRNGGIPTLQCKRCLCLYHPECIGLPPNEQYRQFFCANCDDIIPDVSPARKTEIRQPPALIQLSKAGMGKGRGGMLPSRRGMPKMPAFQTGPNPRGRPPLRRPVGTGIRLPNMQMNQRSVTITPISMPRPVLPKLQPMRGVGRPLIRGGIRAPNPILRRQPIQAIPKGARPVPRSVAPPKLRAAINSSPSSQQIRTSPQVPLFKRYPQSVVTINDKKFICLTKTGEHGLSSSLLQHQSSPPLTAGSASSARKAAIVQ